MLYCPKCNKVHRTWRSQLNSEMLENIQEKYNAKFDVFGIVSQEPTEKGFEVRTNVKVLRVTNPEVIDLIVKDVEPDLAWCCPSEDCETDGPQREVMYYITNQGRVKELMELMGEELSIEATKLPKPLQKFINSML